MTNNNISRPRPGTDSRLRDNLIFKLGVVKIEQTNREPYRGSMLGNVQLSSEPLKSKIEDEPAEVIPGSWSLASFFAKKASESEHSLASSAESASESSSTSHRRLTFNETVTVCPIPKHQEYSNRIKDHLWNSPEEMMQNARRNSIEFAAEGWDWRNSLEDENMYRCVSTNEKIHPVHVEQMRQTR
eukprot:scaffold1184_cov132-Cylindrotheca_fusiformis.AAC.18